MITASLKPYGRLSPQPKIKCRAVLQDIISLLFSLTEKNPPSCQSGGNPIPKLYAILDDLYNPYVLQNSEKQECILSQYRISFSWI